MVSLCGVKVSLERKHFRTINVQRCGNWAVVAVVALPGINNLRAVNTVISSTPAASTTKIGSTADAIVQSKERGLQFAHVAR